MFHRKLRNWCKLELVILILKKWLNIVIPLGKGRSREYGRRGVKICLNIFVCSSDTFLGGADYADMLPPKSFINIGDFKSIKELGKKAFY